MHIVFYSIRILFILGMLYGTVFPTLNKRIIDNLMSLIYFSIKSSDINYDDTTS